MILQRLTLFPQTYHLLNHRRWCHLANNLKSYCKPSNCRNFHVWNSHRQQQLAYLCYFSVGVYFAACKTSNSINLLPYLLTYWLSYIVYSLLVYIRSWWRWATHYSIPHPVILDVHLCYCCSSCRACLGLLLEAAESQPSYRSVKVHRPLFLDQELIPYHYSSCCCWGTLFKKSLYKALRRFKLDRDETWQDCSSSKYASIDGVGFLTPLHNFSLAPMSSFHAKKCCHLVSAHTYAAASASSWSVVPLYLFVC